jgi:SAM-dependent methyltransferase
MNSSEYKFLFELEEHHWWFVGMRKILAALLDDQSLSAPLRILDAGCGTGLNLSWLKRYDTGATVFGLDYSPEALRYSRFRGESLLTQGSVAALPFPNNSFDLIISLEVLDWFSPEEAGRPFGELTRVLKEGGLLLVRLPAFESLRSAHDEAIRTVHRYTAGELAQCLTRQGLVLERETYANTILFPIAVVWRWLHRRSHRQGSDVRPMPKGMGWMNPLLEKILSLEAIWLRGPNRRFPAGLSVIAVARKPHG